jgi:hypothetical protein
VPEREWLEVPVFIHGITSEREPRSHASTYVSFLALVNEALAARGKMPFAEPPIMVEWGWEASLGKDKYLAEAERLVASQVSASSERRRRTLNPLRRFTDGARDAFLYGFADMFYYISEDGGKAVRDNVFRHLEREIQAAQKARGRRGANVSLTFITHSAGTVIAHDFLYRLFGWGAQPVFGLTLNKIRRLSRRKRLRVRRFYTMGSPIAPFIFRSEALVEKILGRERLSPAVIGLGPDADLANPRWVNFWTREDLVAYPVAFFYEEGEGGEAVVVDRCVALGEAFPAVHGAYWRSAEIADAIGETF